MRNNKIQLIYKAVDAFGVTKTVRLQISIVKTNRIPNNRCFVIVFCILYVLYVYISDIAQYCRIKNNIYITIIGAQTMSHLLITFFLRFEFVIKRVLCQANTIPMFFT